MANPIPILGGKSGVRLINSGTHFWVMDVLFSVDADTMQTIVANKTSGQGGNTPIPMSGANLVSMEGPGCAKCGAHWESAEEGYGVGCPVAADYVVAPNVVRVEGDGG